MSRTPLTRTPSPPLVHCLAHPPLRDHHHFHSHVHQLPSHQNHLHTQSWGGGVGHIRKYDLPTWQMCLWGASLWSWRAFSIFSHRGRAQFLEHPLAHPSLSLSLPIIIIVIIINYQLSIIIIVIITAQHSSWNIHFIHSPPIHHWRWCWCDIVGDGRYCE